MPKDDRRAERSGSMAALRDEALRKVIQQVEDRNFSGQGTGGLGRKLLNPRILLLVVALLAGGGAAFLALQTQQAPPAPAPEPVVERVAEIVPEPTMQVLVARDAIDAGQRLTTASLEWQSWPESALRPEYITIDAAPDATDAMQEFVARYTILPGEPIRQDKLAQGGQSYMSTLLAAGKRGVSVAVTAASASGGYIAPNDWVDVLLTRPMPSSQVTDTILEGVRVLAINDRVGPNAAAPAAKEEGASEEGSSDGGSEAFREAIATLELDPEQARLIIGATEIGKLSLVLRSTAEPSRSETAEEQSLNQAIRMSSPFWAEKPDTGLP